MRAKLKFSQTSGGSILRLTDNLQLNVSDNLQIYTGFFRDRKWTKRAVLLHYSQFVKNRYYPNVSANTG